MRSLVSAVSVAALVAHLILGCCWHHAHTAVCQAETVSLADSSAQHSEPDEPCGDGTHPRHGLDHPVHPLCHGSPCQFMPGSAGRHAAVGGHSAPSLPVHPMLAASSWGGEAWRTGSLHISAVPPRPIRAHLFFQVMLL